MAVSIDRSIPFGTVLVATVVVTLGSVAGARQKPDFSGTWVLDAKTPVDQNSAAVAGGSSVLHIEQDAAAIRIRRTYGRESMSNPPVVLTIRLDGSESANKYYGVHREGLTGAISSAATWHGSRLAIVTRRVMTDSIKKASSTDQTTEMLSLEGGRLLVERVTTVPNRPPRKEIYVKR